jgi:hypothetical protein
MLAVLYEQAEVRRVRNAAATGTTATCDFVYDANPRYVTSSLIIAHHSAIILYITLLSAAAAR